MDTMTVSSDERLAKIAAATGDEQERIAQVQLDIERMKELGVLVDIDVHGASMFTARATWAELGIPQQDTRRKRLKRGSKDLIPSQYLGKLRSLETRFRQSLEKHSFVLTGFRPYKWIPFTAYESWREEWDDLQAELAEFKTDVLEHYDEFVDAIAADFAKIAHEAWDAIQARRPDGYGSFVLVTEYGTFQDRDAFVDHVVSRAVSRMPSHARIKADLYVDYKNAMVVTGADVEADLLQASQLRTKRSEEYAKQRVAWEEEEKQRKLLQVEADEAEMMSQLRIEAEHARLVAMRKAELDHARQQIGQMTSPFIEVVEQFRARIFEDVQDIANSVAKNGFVRGRVAERARGLLDIYKLLGAAAGDKELEDALKDLKTSLSKSPINDGNKKYDTASVEAALADIADLTHKAAQEVSKRAGGHTRAGALEI